MDKQLAFYQMFGEGKNFLRIYQNVNRNQRRTYANLYFITSCRYTYVCKKKKIKFGCTCKVVFKSESNKERKCQSVHVRQVNGSEIVIF